MPSGQFLWGEALRSASHRASSVRIRGWARLWSLLLSSFIRRDHEESRVSAHWWILRTSLRWRCSGTVAKARRVLLWRR